MPAGTHDYSKYVDSEQVVQKLKDLNFELLDRQHYLYNPITGEMVEENVARVNYCLAFKKKEI